MAKNIITGNEIVPWKVNPISNTPNQIITNTPPVNNGGNYFPITSPNGVNGTAQTTPAFISPTIIPTTNNVTTQQVTSGGQVANTSPSQIYTNYTNPTPTVVAPSVINTGNPVATLTPEQIALQNSENPANWGTVDENTIRQNQMNAFQAEIDALNAVYANQKLEATQRGMGRLGSDAAIQARRGLLGSSFGSAQTEGVTATNTQEQNAIDAAKNAAISAVQGNIRKAVADEVAAKRKAITEGADANIKYLSSKSERKNALISDTSKNMVDSGAEYSDKDIEGFAKELGIDVSVLKKQYLSDKTTSDTATAKAEQEAKKIQSELDTELAQRKKLGADLTKPFESGGFRYQYDPSTSNYTNLGESRSVSGSESGNYTSKNIPQQVKADLFETIRLNPKSTFSELANAFPEIDTKYLQEIIDSTK